MPSISGASPGGAASLVIIPEHDLAFAAFGNASGAAMLSDRLVLWLLHDYLGLDLPDLPLAPVAVSDLSPYEGTYRLNQMRVDVKAVDGQLEEQMTYEPLDDAQARIYAGFPGGQLPVPPRRLVPIADGLFAPAGIPLQALKGYLRVMLVSFHGRANGRATHRTTGGRMTRRQADSA